MINRYTEPASYFVDSGPWFNGDGQEYPYEMHCVIKHHRVKQGYRLNIKAVCTSRKAADAARRLLSGECEVHP